MYIKKENLPPAWFLTVRYSNQICVYSWLVMKNDYGIHLSLYFFFFGGNSIKINFDEREWNQKFES